MIDNKFDNSELAIKIDNVGKSFSLPHEKQGSLKGMFISMFNGKRTYEKQQVLKDISFEIKKGEFFGIVGRNGSGKSTLLKLISQIYTPDKGEITVNGKLTPFIELGVGFNPELSGRDNVFLNGALLGFSREEMELMYDDIVEFAELEKFMDQKLKNYSSGMQVRLAFSIAIRADTDILVLDEVLAVGDEAFQKKCYKYFSQLKKNKKTVVLVTHDMGSIQRFCNKAIMIEKGEIIISGSSAKVAQRYRELFIDKAEEDSKGDKKHPGRYSNKSAKIEADMNVTEDVIDISVDVIPKINIPNSIISIFIDRDNGEQVYRFSSDEKIGKSFSLIINNPLNIGLKIQNIFPNGTFSLRVSIKSEDRSVEYISVGGLSEVDIDRRAFHGRQWDIHWNPEEEYVIN